MFPAGSKAFLYFIKCSINLMIGLLEKKMQVYVRRKIDPDSSILDEVR